MSLKRKRKVIGILVFAIGVGILLAVTIPFIGWVIMTALALVCCGIYLLKC